MFGKIKNSGLSLSDPDDLYLTKPTTKICSCNNKTEEVIAMKKQKFYYYNRQTLQYEEIRTPLVKKILKYSLIVTATAAYAWGVWTFATPGSIKAFLAEKAQLNQKIAEKTETLDKMSDALESLKDRDDELYRATLALNKIDESTWEGGQGGSIKHADLKNMGDAQSLIDMAQKMDKVKHQMSLVAQSQDAILNKATVEEKKARCIPRIRPLLRIERPLRQLSGFGMRRDPVNKSVWQMHPGIDFGAPQGTPIFATGDGVVVRVEAKYSGYGHNVVIDHGYGYKTLYAHMSKIGTKVGTKVKRGEVIGYVGSTGYSTCPHVHYEVFYGDKRIDPVPYCLDMKDMSEEQFKELAKAVNPDVSFTPIAVSRKYRKK